MLQWQESLNIIVEPPIGKASWTNVENSRHIFCIDNARQIEHPEHEVMDITAIQIIQAIAIKYNALTKYTLKHWRHGLASEASASDSLKNVITKHSVLQAIFQLVGQPFLEYDMISALRAAFIHHTAVLKAFELYTDDHPNLAGQTFAYSAFHLLMHTPHIDILSRDLGFAVAAQAMPVISAASPWPPSMQELHVLWQ